MQARGSFLTAPPYGLFGLLLSDSEIRRRLSAGSLKIEPFSDDCITPNGIDFRVGGEALFILPGPKYKTEKVAFEDRLELPADSVVLLLTLEEVKMPPDLVAHVNIRSTFARMGFTVPGTVVDAGYRGRLTLQVRSPPYPSALKKGERFWHLLFHEVNAVTRPYGGRYQGSVGIEEGC